MHTNLSYYCGLRVGVTCCFKFDALVFYSNYTYTYTFNCKYSGHVYSVTYLSHLYAWFTIYSVMHEIFVQCQLHLHLQPLTMFLIFHFQSRVRHPSKETKNLNPMSTNLLPKPENQRRDHLKSICVCFLKVYATNF